MNDNAQNEITWKIGGEAGFGIMVSGQNFAKTCMRGGLNVFEANEYPSLIRGGHNTETIRASSNPVTSLLRTTDFLVALNKETVDLHKGELTDGAALMYDSNDYVLTPSDFSKPVNLYPVPLLQLAKDNGGDVLMRNTVAIGASMAVMDFDLSVFNGVLADQFKRKGDAVVNQNIVTAKAGYDYVKKNFSTPFQYTIKKIDGAKKRVLVSGNEAIGMGAVAAGLKFFAAYPMTPINGLLHYLASIQEKAKIIYKQPEDEIAAINMAIGASFAGVRSMVASSGGGYALMVEGTSLAAMTETPIVIVYGMRPGPATGLPTWTGQSDLPFILHAGHGEFARIVLSPGDPEEAFIMTMHALNLADRYQTPVFLVTDKNLNESRMSIDPDLFLQQSKTIAFDRGKLLSLEDQIKKEAWDRYEWTDDGISPRPIPGRPNGIFRVNSDEHTPDGYSTEDAVVSRKMVEKRMQKMSTAQAEVPAPTIYGDISADVTLVGWGSTKGAILEAISQLKAKNYDTKINYLHLNWISPFPTEAVSAILSKAKKKIVVEGAHNAPLADYIHEKTDIRIGQKILKYDGRAFCPEDILEGVKTYA